jgi:Dolichyl-phosphate-mannose-protein mannosyltransferase/Protein of unknown function (DUF1420)
MALLDSVAALFAAGVTVLLSASCGLILLEWLGFVPERTFFRLALAAALGVIALELGFFAAQLLPSARVAVMIVLLLLAALSVLRLPAVLRDCARLIRPLRESAPEGAVAACSVGILLWESLAAEAPLTGSDALHYHFAWPALVLRNGFHPDLSLVHSFLTGTGHGLIFAGLALGSEKFSLALLFMAGALSAVSAAGLAREWVSRPVAWIAALAFSVTPVVFWQMTSAGAPDLWMSFFVVLLVLCLAEARKQSGPGVALVCGILSGALAGAKYTGAVIALVAFVYFVGCARSLRRSALFAGGAIAAGIWPYIRNLAWTGDPVFPFASRWWHSVPPNLFALQALREDTGAAQPRGGWHVLEFPFFASIDPAHLGFWQFFGPLCLLFLPFFFFLCRRNSLWRATSVLVIVAGLLIAATSGMARFLLPLFPLALAASLAGCAALWKLAGRWNRALIGFSFSAFLALGCGGMFIYTRPALSAALGLVDREEYLRRRAPDYELSQFANELLAGMPPGARVLVFFRHVYYLRVPFLCGDPADSWIADPAVLRDSQSWKQFFAREHIAYVLREGTYPKPVAPVLQELEEQGVLSVVAERELSGFQGNRINGVRSAFKAALLAVH